MNEPSLSETAFDCPHCDAYTTQHWHNVHVEAISRDGPDVPLIPIRDFEEALAASDYDAKDKEEIAHRFRGILAKEVFTDSQLGGYRDPCLHNVFATQCYNCRKWAVWVHDRVVYPDRMFGALPNQDLPGNIRATVDEARQILDASPRGAAALLRLSIQLLCVHLGQPGKNLNTDIGVLVKEGLSPIVQKSLDVVRVIGNESVHPGTIDVNDDRDAAVRLFDLVNIIAEQMITQPRQVQELYDKLPEDKRNAIEERDRN